MNKSIYDEEVTGRETPDTTELLITAGSLIQEVNRQKVRNTEEFYDEIKKAKKKGGALLLVRRGRTTFLALLTLSD